MKFQCTLAGINENEIDRDRYKKREREFIIRFHSKMRERDISRIIDRFYYQSRFIGEFKRQQPSLATVLRNWYGHGTRINSRRKRNKTKKK